MRRLFMRRKKDWDHIIAVNLTSNFLLMRAEARQMLKQGAGSPYLAG